MEKYMEMYNKNQEIVGPEVIEFEGKEVVVPGMDEDELEEFIEEGMEIGNIKVGIQVNGKTEQIRLIDMQNGRKLFKRLETLNFGKDDNMNAFWYVWREARMKERIEGLPERQREQILAIIQGK